jgi:hypothetical protein
MVHIRPTNYRLLFDSYSGSIFVYVIPSQYSPFVNRNRAASHSKHSRSFQQRIDDDCGNGGRITTLHVVKRFHIL